MAVIILTREITSLFSNFSSYHPQEQWAEAKMLKCTSKIGGAIFAEFRTYFDHFFKCTELLLCTKHPASTVGNESNIASDLKMLTM